LKNICVITIALIVFLGLVSGCGQVAPSSTTTTTTTVSSTNLDAAKGGALAAVGGAAGGTSTTLVGASSNSTVTTSSIRGRSIWTHSGPPDSWFDTDLSASTTGWVLATTESIGGNVTPYMRLFNKSGNLVTGSFLTSKQIANFSPATLTGIMTSGPGAAPTGLVTGIGNFITKYHSGGISTDAYTSINTIAGYLAWAFIYPTMEASLVGVAPGWTADIHTTTPQPTANDKIGSMEVKMVFTKTTSATGEILMGMAVDSSGRPLDGTNTGTGVLYTPKNVMDVTQVMTFVDNSPTTMTFTGVTRDTPKRTITLTVNPLNGSGTGKILDENGVEIGTITFTSAGGSLTMGGVTEAFTF